MKTLAGIAIVLVLALAALQADQHLLTVGTGLRKATSGLIKTSRVYGQLLGAPDTGTAWPLPAGARNIVVYVNGLRYTEALDYQIMNGAPSR